ncbi:hypothetical protein A2875_00205 [Candidatus Gottesmanbacteria bacterium RIFCSPHIGHO2_01_FULL_46_14]|uniref:DUF6922 domain-containing protein n=2 Tax=Candidatus Gottesmaniibacteriota TaxID=1752720 RepID=A0A1F5ZL12_9BACT|nr:MAG: hypothetical protein UY08_C0001G0003 [Candidatus Gottesmanbacteria bacterium GW2011_GWA1_47_8]OGG13111.1 MAG: hypothetical protein A2875_00205 [Candidatus Gottesmanbacteria bacterium RIFCSPHIGHO2_01_FULL_46_14]HLD24298.1 hypothetical protein [Patescibacteria group bacterium]
MENAKLPTSLPREFYRYFWDVNAEKLNPAEHPKYVINRLMNIGNVPSIRWMRQSFSQELIVETVKTVRDFSSTTAMFWAHFYHIPREEVTCMQEPYLSMRRKFWHD